MEISNHGIESIAAWEAFVPWPYDDKTRSFMALDGVRVPVRWLPTCCSLRGTLTIGFGHTRSGAYPLDPRDYIGKAVDKDFAYVVLHGDLKPVVEGVSKLVKVDLTQGEFDALCSFAFNCGTHALATSTLLRKLNGFDYPGARAQFAVWTKSGGHEMPGLVKRRAAEVALWDTNVSPVPDSFVSYPAAVDAPAADAKTWAGLFETILALFGGGRG